MAYRNRTKSLTEESQAFASGPPSMSFNTIQGGNTQSISSNQTYTNMMESTTTSDTSAKKIFKAS